MAQAVVVWRVSMGVLATGSRPKGVGRPTTRSGYREDIRLSVGAQGPDSHDPWRFRCRFWRGCRFWGFRVKLTERGRTGSRPPSLCRRSQSRPRVVPSWLHFHMLLPRVWLHTEATLRTLTRRRPPAHESTLDLALRSDEAQEERGRVRRCCVEETRLSPAPFRSTGQWMWCVPARLCGRVCEPIAHKRTGDRHSAAVLGG